MSKRISYIDIAKGIAMILIVFGHVIVHTPNAYFIYKYIYSFHVVLFFFLSGFTYSNKRGIKEFIVIKFKKLMIPFFVFSTAFLVPYFILGNFITLDVSIPSISQLGELILEILYGNGNDTALKQNTALWFLPALFSSEVIYRCLDKIKIKHKDMIFTIGLLIISYISTKLTVNLPWGINTALCLLFFFQLGILLRKYDIIEKINKSYYLIISLSALVIASCYIYQYNITVDCVDYNYGIYYLFLFTSIIIPVFIICVAKKVNDCKIIEYIGQNTISILIFHKLFVILFQINYSFMPNYLLSDNLWVSIPTAILATIISIVISLIIGYFIKNFMPFIYGEHYKKRSIK